MELGYVVLYLNDTVAGAQFWTENMGMEIKSEKEVMDMKIIQVGFAGATTNFELVPLKLMEGNTQVDVATPSIAFKADDLQAEHDRLTAAGVKVTPIMDHGGIDSFAMFDSEENAFAVIAK